MADKALNRDTSRLDSTTWDHRWGFRDTKMVVQPDECVIMTGSRYNLCGYSMPYLIPFVREELGVDIDFTRVPGRDQDAVRVAGEPQRGLPGRRGRGAPG